MSQYSVIPIKRSAREQFETNYLINQLKKNNGNVSKTADFIGMERSALHRKLKIFRYKRSQLKMNIIICGAGKVGFSISKQLSAQGHSVTVIDQSSEDIKKINETQDVKGIVGRATFPSVLENAGAATTEMIIAVTRNDETNMIICQLAHSLFNINKKIARIRSQEFLEGRWSKLYNKSNLPIDVIISPEVEVAKSLFRRLEAPGALDNVVLLQGVKLKF